MSGRTVVDALDRHTDAPIPVPRFDWERWIRRAPLPSPIKALAWCMATYASKDGANVRPGDQRLAAVMNTTTRTIERNRGELVRLGFLVELPRRRRDDANEYQLTIPHDIDTWKGLLTPDEAPA